MLNRCRHVGEGFRYAETMPRLCARPTCDVGATATMTYGYAARTVWVDDLIPESYSESYDLCAPHADRLTVPLGWVLTDRRSLLRLPFAGLGGDVAV